MSYFSSRETEICFAVRDSLFFLVAMVGKNLMITVTTTKTREDETTTVI